MRDATKRHRLVGLILGAFLIVFVIVSAAMGGVGLPGLPDGAAAYVEDVPEFECVVDGETTTCDGEVTDAEFQEGIALAASELGLPEAPPEDDPQFEQVAQTALGTAIQIRWIRGEADERGIEVSDRDVDASFEQLVNEQIGGEKELQRLLKESAYTEEELRDVAARLAYEQRVGEEIIGGPPEVPEEEIENFYEQNSEQFTQPESRDVREIVNKDEAAVADAKAALEADDSDTNWEKVAAEFSTGDTKTDGGLREDVVEGQDDPALEEEIFGAAEGELVGPFEAEDGFHLIQVVAINPEQVAPLEDASEQIEAQIGQGLQADKEQRIILSFSSKWRARTVCADDLAFPVVCANADPAPDACPSDDPAEREGADPALLDQGCEAPVTPRPVITPGGNAGITGGPPQVLPQGPIKPVDEAAAGGVPPGLEGLPPGTVPPQGGAVPPQGAAPPPQAAPPQGAAPPPGG